MASTKRHKIYPHGDLESPIDGIRMGRAGVSGSALTGA